MNLRVAAATTRPKHGAAKRATCTVESSLLHYNNVLDGAGKGKSSTPKPATTTLTTVRMLHCTVVGNLEHFTAKDRSHTISSSTTTFSSNFCFRQDFSKQKVASF